MRKKHIVILVVLILMLILLKNPYELSNNILAKPSFHNILGTDDLGRDIYSRLVLGTFNSIVIVLISIGLCTIIGNLIGLFTGYYGGIIDYIFQLIIEMILSIPSILILVAVVVIVRNSYISLLLAIFIIYLPLIVNYTRGLVLKEKTKNYIIANKTYGVSNFRLIIKHIYPNIKEYILINFAINFSKGILTEASIGFLGIGLDPSIPTLGNMLNASKSYFLRSAGFTVFPGLVIIFLVYYIRNYFKNEGCENVKKNRN